MKQEKLYLHLSELEEEWEAFLLDELQNLSQGKDSAYFTRYMGHYSAKEYSDREIRRTEKVAREAARIREKLAMPTNEGPQAILNEYVRRYWNNEGNKAGISRAILKERHNVA